MMILKIKDLQASTMLGVYDWEKLAKRTVVLNIEMHVETDKAGVSDDMKDTVDYAMIEDEIVKQLEASSYNLIEKLVNDIGKVVLSLDKRIKSVQVEADKPGALKMARSVSVTGIFTY